MTKPVAICDRSAGTLAEAGLGEIIIYNPNDSIKLNVWMERETVWLTIKQLAQLFDRDRTVIGRHLKNIFSEGELDHSLNNVLKEYIIKGYAVNPRLEQLERRVATTEERLISLSKRHCLPSRASSSMVKYTTHISLSAVSSRVRRLVLSSLTTMWTTPS